MLEKINFLSAMVHSYILLCSFLMITSHGTALNFNLTNISSQNLNVDIIVERDAYISTQGIQLTPDEHSENRTQTAGRASYIETLHLWDKASGYLTDFETHFVFVIDSDRGSIGGDGLTFFLIPPGDSNISEGGVIGLPADPKTYEPTSPFVAVEFDTFYNGGIEFNDMRISTPHVGVDINSMTSIASTGWDTNITYGIENEAWISYNSTSKNLTIIFTGSINNTRVLKELHLLVDLREYLPEWVRIGFSASTGALWQRHTIKSWQFHSSRQIDEQISPSPYNNGFTPKHKKKQSNITRLSVEISVGLSFFVIGLALTGSIVWKRIAKKENAFSIPLSMEKDLRRDSGPKKFSHVELCCATNNFDEEQKLGEGGFGGVYRGFLTKLNSNVAVKRISKGSKQGIKEYAAEVKIISRLRHRSLVQLIGWCHETRELLIVYEFMENSSLDTHLYKHESLLTWEKRYKIAKSLASALLYLHEEWEQCVVHRDVKPSNVMLDRNFNAKLGDFGLARLVDHEKGNRSTVLAGTMGYMAPESVVKCRASKETDVYSFGIVVLEIACGRKPIDTSVMQESHVMLVEFVWDLYGQENLLGAVDSKLGLNFDRLEIERLMIVGLWCAHPDHRFRPSIRQAIHVLNFEAPMPNLPRKMPVATYVSQALPSLSSFVAPGSPIKSSSYSQDTQ